MKLTDISVKTLQDMEALYKQTLADPNADDAYLRGYTNGIRLMYAVLHNQEPDFVDAPERAVPAGQTPLDGFLKHPLLDAFNAGVKARVEGAGSPYHGNSLEHCLHAAGWVQQDLRMALDKAREQSEKRELLGPELPPVPLTATADGRVVPDHSRLSLYLDDLKPRHTNEFERRLLVILDALINDRR